MAKAVVLFSGGLDSTLAIRLMLDQGVEVEALTSASVFHHHMPEEGEQHPTVQAAGRLGVPVTLMDTNDEMLAMVKAPAHGVGKNMNPCIDCRMFLLGKAAEHMRKTGADFIVTGEVVGQRPMSQRREAIAQIERAAKLDGLVLRPLCAKLLAPTIPEKEGLVDRERLLAIKGRSRKEQMALAASFGIDDYPSPAGGCLLTDPGFALRIRELLDHGDPGLNDIRLLRIGRHFRLDDRTKAIMGRKEDENDVIEELARAGDVLLDAADVPGPTVLLRGDASDANVATAARLTVKYGKAKDETSAPLVVREAKTNQSRTVDAAPATEEEARQLMITRETG
jgi:tRNA-specific 2-thiouridylase